MDIVFQEREMPDTTARHSITIQSPVTCQTKMDFMLKRRTTLLGLIAPWIVFAQAPPPMPVDLLDLKLRARLQKIDEHLHGVMGVAAIDLVTGRTLQYNADAVFPTASTIKVPILIEAFHQARAGAFHWSESITLQPSDSVGGSGLLQNALAKGPVKLTLEELVGKMIIDSDNTATNKIIAFVGLDRVNRLTAEMGMRQTRLRRIMIDTEAAIHDKENVTTPLEMARIVESIYRHKAADPADCDSMLTIMQRVPGAIRSGRAIRDRRGLEDGHFFPAFIAKSRSSMRRSGRSC